jgi:hypothetical protein
MERRNLKPGDMFKIKSSLDWEYDDCMVTEDMHRYCGRVAKITRVNSRMRNRYSINLDNEHWNWTAEMFETIITNEK